MATERTEPPTAEEIRAVVDEAMDRIDETIEQALDRDDRECAESERALLALAKYLRENSDVLARALAVKP